MPLIQTPRQLRRFYVCSFARRRPVSSRSFQRSPKSLGMMLVTPSLRSPTTPDAGQSVSKHCSGRTTLPARAETVHEERRAPPQSWVHLTDLSWTSMWQHVLSEYLSIRSKWMELRVWKLDIGPKQFKGKSCRNRLCCPGLAVCIGSMHSCTCTH